MKKKGEVLEINPKDNKSLPYWTEQETMDFLKLTVNSFKKLVTKRKLTRYEIGHRYFYDQNEIMEMIATSKRTEKIQEDFNESILFYKEIELLKKHENSFIINKSKFLLELLIKLSDKKDFLSTKENYILTKCISENGNFTDLSKELNLSKQRVRQIFQKAIWRVRRQSLNMKVDYDLNFESTKQENEKLKQENRELKNILDNLKFPYSSKGDILNKKIRDSKISSRLKNSLIYNDVETLGDVISYTKRDYLKFRNLGKNSLFELESFLNEHGLKLDN